MNKLKQIEEKLNVCEAAGFTTIPLEISEVRALVDVADLFSNFRRKPTSDNS